MSVEQLETIRVETGITFAQECYLDPARAQEFLSQVNASLPNFFTRSNFQHLPKRFTLESFNGSKLCTVRPNTFNYTVHGPVGNEDFQRDVRELFARFIELFALSDVRRIGKIYDFQFPKALTSDSLSSILTIKGPVEISNLHLLFRKEGKNINIHFLPTAQGLVEITEGRINLKPEPIVRCDINNIDTNSPLSFPDTLPAVYDFADSYVRDDLVKFLDENFGATP